MKAERYFLSIMIAVLTIIFTQNVSATYMKYTGQSPLMTYAGGQEYYQDGAPAGLDLFLYSKVQFDVEFIIPEIKYELDETRHFFIEFENPVVKVTASDFFKSIAINNSRFSLEIWEAMDEIYFGWLLTIDITESSFPQGSEKRASIEFGSSSGRATIYQDNYFYRRCGPYPPEWNMGCHEAVLDMVTDFSGEHTGEYLEEYPGGLLGLFGTPVSVSEPFTITILLTGLAGLFFARRIKSKGTL